MVAVEPAPNVVSPFVAALEPVEQAAISKLNAKSRRIAPYLK
jgi:hypothetical protein